MIHANIGPAATSFTPDLERVASFDREGRLQTFTERERTWRRTLSGALFERRTAPVRGWDRLDAGQATIVLDRARELAREVMREARGELAARLRDEILPWTAERLLAERERFDRAYRPVSILPPDRYASIVLQATEGCSWNGCTFCSFYAGRPFSVRDPGEFERHVAAVGELLGRGVLLRRGIFLADGNALAVGRRRLEPLVDLAVRAFPGHPLSGFVDLWSGERRGEGAWAWLRERGLERLYLGMETGLDELLARVNKPGSSAELVRFVHRLKAERLAISLIVMVGLGGRTYRLRHREATLASLERLPLADGDRIYLSPYVGRPGDDPGAGEEPMTAEETELESRLLSRAIRSLGLATSRYDIREFVY